MALCDPCKGDEHERCRSKETRPIRRKGKLMKPTHLVVCECVECHRPKDWRGEPQPVPKWGRGGKGE